MFEAPKIERTDTTEIFCYRGKCIETDRKDNKRYDNVLPIWPGSSVHYLIDHMIVHKGDKVLDLCTGSGVLGIFAAERARNVIATDMSQRALEFAERNAKRNNAKNIEFRQGDLWYPVLGEQFDYIICNPPFVPVPYGLKAALHTDGGNDGLALARRILGQAELFLEPTGRMQMYSLSLGTDNTTLLESVLEEHIKSRKVIMMSMYSRPLPVAEFARDFEPSTINQWSQQMADRGLTHLHSNIVTIEPGEKLEIIKTVLPEAERITFPDNWVNWKGRFSYWIR
ncbi:methyltransferase [Candidatus Woesearchaeota archaeon]|nr:methyltransferase [Candidatus Woesearchaeota archaeon]